MKFGMGSNTQLTQKYERGKVQHDIHTSKHIHKQTNIPDFQLCYSCECLACQLYNTTTMFNSIIAQITVLHGIINPYGGFLLEDKTTTGIWSIITNIHCYFFE